MVSYRKEPALFTAPLLKLHLVQTWIQYCLLSAEECSLGVFCFRTRVVVILFLFFPPCYGGSPELGRKLEFQWCPRASISPVSLETAPRPSSSQHGPRSSWGPADLPLPLRLLSQAVLLGPPGCLSHRKAPLKHGTPLADSSTLEPCLGSAQGALTVTAVTHNSRERDFKSRSLWCQTPALLLG